MEKIINKYKINIENGYVVGFYTTLDNDFDFEGQMADYPNATKGWTKFVNGQFVEDETKKAEILDREEKLNRINELKQMLNETDYIYNSLREEGRPEGYYDDVIAQRKEWRKEIQELEGRTW